MKFSNILSSFTLVATSITAVSAAFDANSNDNVVVYWGQASAGFQDDLSTYCESDDIDLVILSFMIGFPGTNDIPTLNFAGACYETFSNGLLKCDKIAQDIKTCQNNGKKILLSLGGAVGSYGFTDDSQAETFASTLWDMFLEGSSETRPFGDAIIDGFDFDIENNNPTGYAALANTLRSDYFSKGTKDYYLGAAPQCVYPDASVGDLLDKASIDFVFVQFYNNYCNVDKQFNWDTWINYASTISPNKDVKIYLGLPGSKTAAGSGYIDISLVESTLETIESNQYFGGVMLWDASQSFSNKLSDGRTYVGAIKEALISDSSSDGSSTSTFQSTSATVPSSIEISSSTSVESTSISTSSTSSTPSSSSTKITSSFPSTFASSTSVITSPSSTFSSSSFYFGNTSTTQTTPTGASTTTFSTSSTTSLPSSTSTSTSTPGTADCTSLTGQSKADCLNTNYENGQYDGNLTGCTHGTGACTKDGKYAVCNWGEWVTLGCAAGTTCYASAWDNQVSIGCNWPRS